MNFSDRLLVGAYEMKYRMEYANDVMFPNAWYIAGAFVLIILGFYLYIKCLPCKESKS